MKKYPIVTEFDEYRTFTASEHRAVGLLKQCHTEIHQTIHHYTHGGSTDEAKAATARLIQKLATAMTLL